MAISYPINIPTTIGIESITLRAVNAVAISQSPFSFKQQVVSHKGQRWEASVTIPSQRRELVANWKAFLVSLKGQTGTFLLGDPDYQLPRGTVSSCLLTGLAGTESPTVVMTGTLLAGDYIQLGTGASSRLHTVLTGRSGNGTLEIWPALRADYTSAEANTIYPKGVFKLSSNISSWSIGNNSAYQLSFDCMEAI